MLLVGAILGAVGAVLLVGLAFGMAELMEALDAPRAGAVGYVYGVLGLMQGVGAALGFVAYTKAKEGDMNGAFTFGLIASMLPPLRILLLLGAIFCKVSEDDDG